MPKGVQAKELCISVENKILLKTVFYLKCCIVYVHECNLQAHAVTITDLYAEKNVCYLLYKKKIELWVYVAHQILQQSTCHNHVLKFKLYECTKFGTNIGGEMCTNSVT